MNKKSGSYYKYAIGEIILVVIGILIAIQVDAWYKMKTEQEEINSYLLSIQREFEIEIYWIEEIKLKSLKDQLQDLNSMTRILINQETDSLDYIVNYASELDKNKGIEFFDFPIVDEFIQLDYLAKIKDDSLRLDLKEYNKIVDYLNVDWKYSTEQQANIIQPFLVDNFTYLDLNPDSLFRDKIIPKVLRKNYENLFSDRDFFNIISLKANTVKKDINSINLYKEALIDILKQLIRYNNQGVFFEVTEEETLKD